VVTTANTLSFGQQASGKAKPGLRWRDYRVSICPSFLSTAIARWVWIKARTDRQSLTRLVHSYTQKWAKSWDTDKQWSVRVYMFSSYLKIMFSAHGCASKHAKSLSWHTPGHMSTYVVALVGEFARQKKPIMFRLVQLECDPSHVEGSGQMTYTLVA